MKVEQYDENGRPLYLINEEVFLVLSGLAAKARSADGSLDLSEAELAALDELAKSKTYQDL